MNNIKFYALVLFASTLVLGCSKYLAAATEENKSPQKYSVEFDLPPGWEAFETIDNRYSGKDVSIVTDVGSLVSVHILPKDTFDKKEGKQTFLELHVSASLPKGPIRDSAKMDVGEVDRMNFEGVFARIKTPEPNLADYIIEVFVLDSPEQQQVVVFNTPQELLKDVQCKQDFFLQIIANDDENQYCSNQ